MVSNNRGSSSIGTVSGSKVISTGSNNSRLISGDNSSVGVGNKAGNMDGGSSIGVVSNNRGGSKRSMGISSKLGGQVVSSGSSHCWLINRGYCSIRVGLETIESLGCAGSNASGKNQKLHVVYLCARAQLPM